MSVPEYRRATKVLPAIALLAIAFLGGFVILWFGA